MSLYKTPYQTTTGSNYTVAKVVNALRELLVVEGNSLQYLMQEETKSESTDQPILLMLTGKFDLEANIPSFVHPLEVIGVDKKKYLFIDVRNFVKYVPHSDGSGITIRNRTEYNFARARQIMTKIWMTNGPEVIDNISSIPNNVFSSWVSEGIAHRFALNMFDQLKLAIIVSFYYQCLFVEGDEITDAMRETFNAACIRELRAPAKIVFETTDKIKKLTNIADLCTTVQTILENPRLTDFNAGLLITILKNSWFGTNAGDILAVALEHPPTWVSLVFVATSERTYKNSNIAKITERYTKKASENAFTRSFVALAEGTN